MADAEKAGKILRYVIDFDELSFDALPDKPTADDRRAIMVKEKQRLERGEVEAGFEREYVATLDHYKEAFGGMYNSISPRLQSAETHVKFLYCVSMLKLLTGRLRMSMLLHDLREIYDDLG